MSNSDDEKPVKPIDSEDEVFYEAITAALEMTDSVSKKSNLAFSGDSEGQDELAKRLGIPFIKNLRDFCFDEAILSLIPAEFARKNDVIPFKLSSGHLTVAMANPMRHDIFQALGFITGDALHGTMR